MMTRDELISKWLDHDLNPEELEAFKALEDYEDLITLNQQLQEFKAEDYNTNEALNTVLSKIDRKNKPIKRNWIKPFLRVAAILAIGLSVYFYTSTLNTAITTASALKTTIELPDTSKVTLNTNSALTYNKHYWNSQRDVSLEGEAYFKVAKGATFKVSTNLGVVTVYGTQFNVKQRDNYFEVICYEGLVGVTYNSKETKLNPGDHFLVTDGKLIAKDKEYRNTPSWLHNESEFKSTPLKHVIAAFETHYNTKVKLVNVDGNLLFTGTFTHENRDIALKSISLPLQLKYIKNANTIILEGE